MTISSRRSALALRVLVCLGLALGTLAFTATTPAHAEPNVVVSPTPDPKAPRVANGRVYAIDSYGPLVVVGGSFTNVRVGAGGSDIPRQWIFLYNRDTGFIDTAFVPELSGPAPAPDNGLVKDQPGVEAVQFAPDGQSIYVGGWFTSANGTPKNRLVRLNLDGEVIPGFNPDVNGVVNDFALTGDRLIVGGRFGRVNGQPVDRLVSLDPRTGATQTDFNLPASVSRNQYGAYVDELDVSPNGRWMVVSGSFKQIGNKPRNQLAVIDLGGTPKVANWSTDAYTPNCSAASTEAGSYIRGLSISPDSSYFVVNTTGAFVGVETTCDTSVRWELPPKATGDGQTWTWRAKTGGDTLWAAEITRAAVYVGGHQRWMNNPQPTPGGDNDGPGSVERPGIAALDPATGVPLSWNPGRDRGRGVEAMHFDDQFLYLGHDTNLWGGAIRQRLAQLPFAGGTTNPQPTEAKLPVQLWFTTGDSLNRAAFDGATVGGATSVSGPPLDGENWSSNRGGFVQDGRLHYFGADQAFYSRTFDNGVVGAPTNLSTSVGYVDTNFDQTPYDQPFGVAETRAATYADGQIYYVKSTDSKLYKRGYSLESGIIEGSEYVVSSKNFSGARALTYIGEWLYAAWSDGKLYRFYAPDGKVDFDSRTLVDSGSSIDWNSVRGFWTTPGYGLPVQPPVPAPVTCSGETPWKASYWPNATLQGTPNTTRCEAAIDYTWGTGAPAGADVPGDNFSASWTRTMTLTEPGAIKVQVEANEGARVYVDGVRVIDAWTTGAGTNTGVSQALEPGEHQVRVDYFERTGDATARVSTEIVAPPAPPAEPDNLPGETTIIAPPATVGGNAPVAVTAAGEATDNVGVTAVRVSVQNRATSQWLQADGTWGSAFALHPATVDSPGATSTTWSFGMSLPHGDYAVEARAVDAAGNEDLSPARRVFTVTDPLPPADTEKPTVTVTAPVNGETVTTPITSISGSAQDDIAPTAVRVAVWNRAGTAETRWLQADGTWGPNYAFRTATLATPGAASTTWSLDVPLPDGQYALDVRARDDSGKESDPRAWVPFVVDTNPPDAANPTVTVTSPTNGAQVTTSTVPVRGSAADDIAPTAVRVAVWNRAGTAETRWLQADGTWGPNYAFRTATLATPGAASTTWSLDVPLPDGQYALDVRARDAAGKETDPREWVPFTVNTAPADHTAPTVTVKAPAKNATVTSRTVNASGTIADNVAIGQVRVGIYDRTAPAGRQWLQANGTWGGSYAFRAAQLSGDGTSASWSLPVNLADGLYAFDVKGVDAAGNVSASTWHPFVVNAPDADTVRPRAALAARDGFVVKGNRVTLKGNARDNKGFGSVLVSVARPGAPANKRWLQANGTWGEVQSFRKAKLAKPGTRDTGWRFALRLPAGTYRIEVMATDKASNLQRSPVTRTVRVKARTKAG